MPLGQLSMMPCFFRSPQFKQAYEMAYGKPSSF
jgi:hypothetical protein